MSMTIKNLIPRLSGLLFKIFSILCVLALAVCLICDLAINKRLSLSWSLYVLSAVPFAWLVLTPLLVCKRNRIMLALAAFSAALLPYLYLTALLTGGGWFSPLGLPIGLIGLAAFWLTWLLIRFAKINKWFISAALVFLYGVLCNTTIIIFVNLFLRQRWFGFSEVFNLITCTALTVMLCIIGYGKRSAAETTDAAKAAIAPETAMPQTAASEEDKPTV